jgi:hypothetical protein
MATDMHDDPADPTDAPGSDRSGADPATAGLEQFQRAALEAIRAGRAMLDAAESILQDPAAAEAVVRSVGTVARNATEAVAGFASGRWPASGTTPDTQPDDDPDEDPPDGFERISVS